MGIRLIPTALSPSNPVSKFYGKELKRVKGYFFHPRRRLVMKKANNAIKIGNKEGGTVNIMKRAMRMAWADSTQPGTRHDEAVKAGEPGTPRLGRGSVEIFVSSLLVKTDGSAGC